MFKRLRGLHWPWRGAFGYVGKLPHAVLNRLTVNAAGSQIAMGIMVTMETNSITVAKERTMVPSLEQAIRLVLVSILASRRYFSRKFSKNPRHCFTTVHLMAMSGSLCTVFGTCLTSSAHHSQTTPSPGPIPSCSRHRRSSCQLHE